MELLTQLSLITIAGALPAFIWLWIVLTEDRVHPEPRKRLIISFLVGMLAVVVVIPLEWTVLSFGIATSITLALWAFIEEAVKYFFANSFALKTKDVDEPLDDIIYMAVTALGFAALENMLFLATPAFNGNFSETILLAHARFLGSTIVHLISSVIIGIFLAETFWSNKTVRRYAGLLGLLIASIFHAFYNFFVISIEKDSILFTFVGLWAISLAIIVYTHHMKNKYTLQSEHGVQ